MSIDTSITQTNINGQLVLNLSSLLQQLPQLVIVQVSDTLSSVISFRSLNKELTNFYLPQVNLRKFYDLGKFNSNYLQAFGASFPFQCASKLLYGLDISIVNDLNFSSQQYLDQNELNVFRFLTCMCFGLVFNIVFTTDCACYPKTLNELAALSAGIGLNCVSLDCRNQLKQNPLLFNDLFHTDCENVNFNAAFVSLDVFAGQNLNINLDITQTNQQADMTTALTNSVNALTASVNVLQDQFSGLSDLYPADRAAFQMSMIQIGMILPLPPSMLQVPLGFLKCDGSIYNIVDYPDLYARIGASYSTTSLTSSQFQVPDFRGRFIYGDTMASQIYIAATVTPPSTTTSAPASSIVYVIKAKWKLNRQLSMLKWN